MRTWREGICIHSCRSLHTLSLWKACEAILPGTAEFHVCMSRIDALQIHSEALQPLLQDDAAAAHVLAPLALLVGCCGPFLTSGGGAAAPETWLAHLVLVVAYLTMRFLLAACPRSRCAAAALLLMATKRFLCWQSVPNQVVLPRSATAAELCTGMPRQMMPKHIVTSSCSVRQAHVPVADPQVHPVPSGRLLIKMKHQRQLRACPCRLVQ